MIPKEIYNRRRRHNNTPQSLLLIITNYVVTSVLFTAVSPTGWFFAIAMAGLILYNYYTIRRNREEYTRINIIVYIASWLGIVGLFFITRNM